MNTLRAFWWRPGQHPRSLLSEVRHNWRAWPRMRRWGGQWLRNFGDELSAISLELATGRRVVWSPLDRAEVVGIGSILELYLDGAGPARIWGSGLRNPDVMHAIDASKVLAVRGAKTRDALGLPHGTSLGDPGLLAGMRFESRYRSGTLCVPHFSVFNTAESVATLKQFRSNGITIMPPAQDVAEVCSAIANAEFLLTSSLHGLIVADAVGTPCALVGFRNSKEPAHKYHDYMSIFGHEPRFHDARDVATDPRLRNVRDLAESRTSEIGQKVGDVVESLILAAKPLRS